MKLKNRIFLSFFIIVLVPIVLLLIIERAFCSSRAGV